MHAFIPAMTGSAWFAVDAMAVQEVIGERPWVALPFAPARVPGVISWRGRAVSVLDVGDLFEAGESLRLRPWRVRTLIVEAGGCTLAVPVDVVREAHDVGPHQLRSASVAKPYAPLEVSVLEGVMPVLDVLQVLEQLLDGQAVAS